MKMRRREFIGATSALVAGLAAPRAAHAQEGKDKPPTRAAKVERLFKAPDIHPNALEAAPDGLWIGDQVSEKVFKVDWKSGKVLQELQTESHNTSGLAIGGGFMWLGANGGVSGRRPPRPQDKPYGEVVQADLKTGKTIKIHPLIWGGGVHGITYVPQSQTLWVTALSIQAVAEMDPKVPSAPHAASHRRSSAWTRLGQRRAVGPDCRRSSREEDRSGVGQGAGDHHAVAHVGSRSARHVHP